MEIKEEEFNTQTFVEIFQKLSTHYKDKAAITGSGKTYTYEDVNLYSNYLAKHLIDSGVCSGDVVMIKLSRRPETLIAILGIWKAGGAYLFLDDSYPEARNNKLINETGCQIIIDSDYISRVPLKKDPELIDRSERDGLAVLVYTSGSTSKPKGVKLLHRNVMASISNSWRLGFNEKDVMCVFPSFSFVASIYDTFGQLVRGGSLNLIPEEKRRNIDLIEEHFITNKITIAYLPPHMAKKLIARDNPKLCLRALLVGGEVVRNLEPHRFPFLNVYAASETCSLAFTYRMDKPGEFCPIGKPNPNLLAYLVDENGKPVEKGEEGELWLAGPQISPGYYKREEQTKEQFMKNPFCDEPGYDWLFRTRDICRELPDGNLIFVARADTMYKIRGFRVEGSAVENVILAQEGIQEVVVKAFTDSGGTDILCGYFTANEKKDVKELKKALKEVLPYYMVPTALFQLDEMPLNMNRKIDRKAIKPPKELDDHKLLEKLY